MVRDYHLLYDIMDYMEPLDVEENAIRRNLMREHVSGLVHPPQSGHLPRRGLVPHWMVFRTRIQREWIDMTDENVLESLFGPMEGETSEEPAHAAETAGEAHDRKYGHGIAPSDRPLLLRRPTEDLDERTSDLVAARTAAQFGLAWHEQQDYKWVNPLVSARVASTWLPYAPEGPVRVRTSALETTPRLYALPKPEPTEEREDYLSMPVEAEDAEMQAAILRTNTRLILTGEEPVHVLPGGGTVSASVLSQPSA